MKKIILVLVLAVATLSSARAEFRWGPTVGVNYSDLYFQQALLGTSQMIGPNVGLIGEMMFPGIGFGVDFALKYRMVGSKVDFGEFPVWSTDGYGNENVWLHMVSLPINLRFKYTNLMGVERYAAPFVYGGPVFNLIPGNNGVGALKYSHGSIGVQVGVGGEFIERLQISAGYYWGLTKEVRTRKLEGITGRTQGWMVNAAWLF